MFGDADALIQIKRSDTLDMHAAGEQLAFKVNQPEQGAPANGSP